jgi:hypothetical protein
VFKFSNASLLAQDERVTDGQLADEMKILRFSRSVSRTNRRNFVTSLGIAAGAAGTLGLAGCSNDGAIVLSANDTNPSVVDVLNFALNLEYLEASFYNYIATGSGISSANLGTGAGTITPIPQVTFANSFVTTLAQNLAWLPWVPSPTTLPSSRWPERWKAWVPAPTPAEPST